MILLNTRPKNLSKKINNLCNLEKIELQNIHLSEIISIHINNNSQPYKEIFQNLNNFRGIDTIKAQLILGLNKKIKT